MGVYLNPGNNSFKQAINSKIYVDKTALIQYTNEAIDTMQRFICISRPRRFGKSMAANMLAAYYGKDCDSSEIFDKYKISKNETYGKNLNQYNVIFLNVTFESVYWSFFDHAYMHIPPPFTEQSVNEIS